MGRTREFDEATVLDAAAGTFGRLGFAGTSVDALVAATGLHRGSLYGAFGSKRGVFVAALRRACEDPSGPAARSDALVLVALMELAGHDDEVRSLTGRLLAARGLDGPTLGARLLDRAGLAARTPVEEES